MTARGQAGAALIAVLWVLVLLTTLVGSFTAVTRTETTLAHHSVVKVKGRAAVEAALHMVLFDLNQPTNQRLIPDDGSVFLWRFNDHDVTIDVADTGGRIDLNTASRDLLGSTFSNNGLDDELVDKILDEMEDWRDADDSRQPNGAEDDDYEAAGRSYGAKDGPFQTVDELAQVLSVPPRFVEKIRNALTVHSSQTGISATVASPDALRALPMDQAVVEQFLEDRQQARDDGLEPPQAPPEMSEYLSSGQGVAYIVKLTANSLDGTKTVLETVVMPGFINKLPRIIEWREDGT